MLQMTTSKPIIILADNGSTKASATLQLRSIAQQLSERTQQKIHPVSLQHADSVAVEELNGMKASVLKGFLREQLQNKEVQGEKLQEFIILPLFFGNSRALTKYIPDVQAELEREFGKFKITIKDTLYILSQSPDVSIKESRLSKIIAEHILQTSQSNSIPLKNIVLVDHGSPSPEITAVRNGVANELKMILGEAVDQAAMERRRGKQYDFNGELLETWLYEKAEQGVSVIIALMFSLPGRHAGEGGDIEAICQSVKQRHPNFKVAISPLVGDHPLLLDILSDRLNA
jgi:sirohydrochlorin ferrochelatase